MQRLIVGISGATGAIYGVRILEFLRFVPNIETHLILSDAGKRTILEETDYRVKDVEDMATTVYPNKDIGAAPASGSFHTMGMVIAPCSVKTLSAVANSYADSLISRAADVTLKECRRLVILLRETPLHPGHLRLMQEAAQAGAILLPPMPAFYNRPKTLDDIVNHTVGRTLDLFGVEHKLVKEWLGTAPGKKRAEDKALEAASEADIPLAER